MGNIADMEFMDDASLLYAAIYSNFEMARLMCKVMERIDEQDMPEAMYYAATGKKEELLALVR